MPKEAGRWPNLAAADRDESFQLAEATKGMLQDVRKAGLPPEVEVKVADAITNQERIARLLEKNGAKK